MRHSPATMDVFRTTFTFDGGLLHPGDQPGLGVSLDDRAAEAYPYVPAYLPTARLADGTVHDW
jgi:mannonate dehydratase